MAISEKRSAGAARGRRPMLHAVGTDGDDGRESTVATELAQTRLALGIDLATVADELHIREEHLEAIEAGRFDALPGPTYTIGFLRSYARFLSLDSDRLIDQFRVESAGFAAQRKLRFPSPIDDGRIPTVPVLVFALVLAGAIGFGWYYVSDVEQVAQEGVPEVPAHLVAPPPTPTPVEAVAMPQPPTDVAVALPDLQIPAPPPAEAASAADAPVEAAEAPAETGVAIDIAELDTAAGGEVPALPSVALEPQPAAAPVVEVPAASEPVAPIALIEPAAVAAPDVTIEAPMPRVPAETAAAVEVAVTAAATVDVPAPAVTDGGATPRVYGQANTDARVRLRATEECWIQITGPGNELLLTRILKPGDVYLVPNRPGIVMMTGNAGGLEIALDGEVLPPIGPAGAVRRNIALDPEALRAHQASSQ
jgi:cytoskeleton protein RodZ